MDDSNNFKFNFNPTDDNEEVELQDDKGTVSWKSAKELNLSDSAVNHSFSGEKYQIEECNMMYFSAENILGELRAKDDCNSDVLTANDSHSDLIPGVYEGGLKIWECTHDLMAFIVKNNFEFDDKKCIDLGCGAGIVGIYTLLKGASTVYFQDYDSEVLKHSTMPNLLLNVQKMDVNVRFYSGDWKSFRELVENDFREESAKFDYIFTSETIYNRKNYKKLHDLFKAILRKSGEIYLAAKNYYFGVGGGLREFEEFLLKENVFNSRSCWGSREGMKREIIKITFKTL